MRTWLALFLILLTCLISRAQTPPPDEVQVLVMAPEFRKDWALTKDRDSIAANFQFILEPGTMDELIEEVAKVGRGGRIRRMVILGHGYQDDKGKGGIIEFTDAIDDQVLRDYRVKAYNRGEARLLDAFAPDAEIIYFNCDVAQDPEFLPESANLFLAFSGGTVYGSDKKVKSDVSMGNRLTYLLSWLSFVDLNFKAPSTVDYHLFRKAQLPSFVWRQTESRPCAVKGPTSVPVNTRVTLTAQLPPEYTRAGLAPHIRCQWLEVGPKGNVRLATQPELTVECNQKGAREFVLEVRLDNGLGARNLDCVKHRIEVGDDQSRAESSYQWLRTVDTYLGELLVADEEALRRAERRCGDYHARVISQRFPGGSAKALQMEVLAEQQRRGCLVRPTEEHKQHQADLKSTRQALAESRLAEGAYQEYAGYKDFAGYLAAVEKFKARCRVNLPHPIPQPAPLPWSYATACSSDEGGQISPLTLKLQAARQTLNPGEPLQITAEVKGGTPPYTYRWSPDGGDAASLTFSRQKPGPHEVTLIVTDRAQNQATAHLRLQVAELVARVLEPAGAVSAGQPTALQCQILVAGKPVSGNYLIRWQPGPEVTFDPQDSRQQQVRATFARVGPAKVWVQILDPQTHATLAESPPVELEVVIPKAQLATQKLLQAHERLRAGAVVEAARLGKEAGELDARGSLPGRRDLCRQISDQAWKSALDSHWGQATEWLEASLSILSDERAQERLVKVKGAQQVWPQVQALGKEVESLVGLRKLPTAQPKVNRLIELGNRLIYEGAQHPYVKSVTQAFYDCNDAYNRFQLNAESRVGDHSRARQWERMLAVAQEAEEWELFPVTRTRVDGWRRFAQQKLAQRTAHQQFYNQSRAAFEAGRLGPESMLATARQLRQSLQDFATDHEAVQPILQLVAQLEAAARAPRLTATIQLSSPTVTVGQPFSSTARAQGGVPPYQFQWKWGEQPTGQSAEVQQWTVAAPGSFRLGLEVSDSRGQRARAETRVTARAAAESLKVYVLPREVSLQPGQKLRTQAQISGGTPPYRCQWSLSGQPGAQTGPSADWQLSQAGTFTLTATVTDATGKVEVGLCLATVAAGPTGQPIRTGTTSSGTRYQPVSQGDVFQGGFWCNARNGSDWVQRDFGASYRVTSLSIESAGTDVTTDNSSIEIQLQRPDGSWHTLDRLQDTNINWSELSGGARGRSQASYARTLQPPLEARAFRLVLNGHGWFTARNIQIFGDRLEVKPPPPPSAVEIEGVFANQSSAPVHLFLEGDNFGPGNRFAPGESRRLRVRLGRDGRVKIHAGQNGRILATRSWEGDPDHPNRYPRVIFTPDGQLSVTTGLR